MNHSDEIQSGGGRDPCGTDLIRKTLYGDLQGFVREDGCQVWLGIPYAAPPVGPLRWRAPKILKAWDGVRSALSAGKPCVQPPFILSTADPSAEQDNGSEDCLYLNIWAPTSAHEPVGALPVMFWVHGGGNTKGNAATFDGGILAKTQRVIVVTANFRLGIFGWFRHPSLRDADSSPEDNSGNYGILDLIAALKWVRDNIEVFGGDPNNITVFGESAGGANIFSLLLSPLASGLFQRAIIQSGVPTTTAAEQAENFFDDPEPGEERSSGELLLQLLIDDGLAVDRCSAKMILCKMDHSEVASYLRGKDYDQFATAYQKIPIRNPLVMPRAPQLFRDGFVLPSIDVDHALAIGSYNRVPLILGATRDEHTMILPYLVGPSSTVVKRDSAGVKITDPHRYRILVDYLSAFYQADSVCEPARSMVALQPDSIFCYRFDWDDLQPAPWLDHMSLGATHSLDVAFIFGHLDVGPEYIQNTLIAEDSMDSFYRLSRSMMAYWAEFARTGNPGSGGSALPVWTPMQSGLRRPENWLVLDGERGGGVRMEHTLCDASSIAERFQADQRITSETRKSIVDELFLLRFVFRKKYDGRELFNIE